MTLLAWVVVAVAVVGIWLVAAVVIGRMLAVNGKLDEEDRRLREAIARVVDAEQRREEWGPDTEATFPRAVTELRLIAGGKGR